MRTIKFLLEKEFRQIFRNKSILALITVMPIMQLIVMPLAADYEVKNINLAVVDNDRTSISDGLIESAVGSGYFVSVYNGNSRKAAMSLIELDKADLILEIPNGFEKTLVKEQKASVSINVNAINGMKANLGSAYLNSIVAAYNKDIRTEFFVPGKFSNMPVLELNPINRFNIHMNYRIFMVPGILAILVTMVGGFLTALNIVKEKEVGTIEQINVTPIKRHHFIIGKLLPFWILGMFVFTIGMLVSYVVYGIVPIGNLSVLYGFVAIYLLGVMGLGLLVSTYSETQQQAMFIMFFFMMVFILMGGLFTSLESMPDWAQKAAAFNPMTYFIQVLRMVILKGSGWADISRHLMITCVFAIVLNVWAVVNYRKTA